MVLLPESIQFLHEHDFSTEELIEEFGSLDNPEIVISADYIRNLEVSLSEEDPIKGNGNLIFGKADPDAFDCLIRAVGIDAVITLFNGKVTKEIAKKAIRKIVGRTLGWIGVAWAIYEYGDCMKWY